ncbi:hypothetical protein OROHE_003484 [Orobanche hederae]
MIKSIYQPLSFTFFIFLLFSFSSAHNKTKQDSPSSNSQDTYKGCFPKVYAFGDSDTDTGNAQFLGGRHIQGGINFSVSAQVPARLVVDFLCQALSLPSLPPYKNPSADFKSGVNFAISGSTCLSADYFRPKNLSSLFWNGVPMSFQTQIDWFKKYLNAGKGKDSKGSHEADIANALFWIGQIGVSDYTSAIGSSIPLHSLAESSVKHVCELLTTLVANGAKYVVVQGLPPVGCFPMYMSSTPRHNLDHAGCVATVNAAIMAHNQILQWALEKFRKMYPHCSVLYADYWNAYLTIAMNPNKYQMEEPFKACCGSSEGQFNFNKNKLCGSSGTSVCKDPHKYINWDGVHLTEAMHKHLVDLFLHQGFCHPSFDELVKSKKSM